MAKPACGPLYSIVLAAGKGRRMRNRYMHKVCFDIAGVPAILRALDTYNRLGVAQNVVVVGEMAGQVVETVGERFSNVVFAYQAETLGTGDAARCGLQALSAVDDNARVLVVAGDKLIDSQVLSRLVDEFDDANADLQILVSPAEFGGETAGRILLDDDECPRLIAELADVNLRACRAELHNLLTSIAASTVSRSQIQAVITQHLGQNGALDQVLGSVSQDELDQYGESLDRSWVLAHLEKLPYSFCLGPEGPEISAEDARNSRFRNESIYLVRKKALAYALRHMPTDNAQGEQYLTDAIGVILNAGQDGTAGYRTGYVATNGPHDIMSYNNPEELLRISDFFHGQRQQSLKELSDRLGPRTFRTVAQWLEAFPEDDRPAPDIDDALAEHYGDDLVLERRQAFRAALLRFQEALGPDRHAIIVRSPGRINLMGRHVDWQGGCCNLMAVNQEVIMVVSPRNDDRIEVRNVQPDLFPDTSISLGRLVSDLNWDDWLSCVNCGELELYLRQAAGSWNIYIEAAMLRLQMAFRGQLLRGMDIVVNGNIPVAAGMSSSSALVVSAAESAAALNGLDVTARQFVNFCGEGEWFVGTRGGSADHAAMKYGAKGTINHVKFHEFELLEQIKFPDSHAMVVCNSFMQAKKAAGAKDAFNSRVASYLLGVALVRLHFPQYAPLIRFVRDIDCETLRVPLSKIYEILIRLPESMIASEVRELFREQQESWATLAPYFENAPADTQYPVRGVLWFGISECTRARQAAICLQRKDMIALGELMSASHDGERCFHVDDHLNAEPFLADISDLSLHRLIADLSSEDPSRVERAQLHHQPGAYRCSIQEIDAIVDIACRTPGVAGAQIAGAGLGGCAMVLVQRDAIETLEQRLTELFYSPRSLPSGVIRCTPSAGSCLLSVPTGPEHS